VAPTLGPAIENWGYTLLPQPMRHQFAPTASLGLVDDVTVGVSSNAADAVATPPATKHTPRITTTSARMRLRVMIVPSRVSSPLTNHPADGRIYGTNRP
jgi:hypothetical protein